MKRTFYSSIIFLMSFGITVAQEASQPENPRQDLTNPFYVFCGIAVIVLILLGFVAMRISLKKARANKEKALKSHAK